MIYGTQNLETTQIVSAAGVRKNGDQFAKRAKAKTLADLRFATEGERHSMSRTTSARNRLIARLSTAWVAIMLGYVAPLSAQITITEVMYDPLVAGDIGWEWIEVQNTSGSAVDLHGWVFSDRAALYASSNFDNELGDTLVPAGGVAVIYNAPALDMEPARFSAAWTSGIQLIPVNVFPALNNAPGGDRIGIWSRYENYNPGGLVEPNWDAAVAQIDYATANGFPSVGGGGKSIAWNGSGSPAEPSNWVASAAGELGAITSVQTTLQGGQLNSTADVGTPGLFVGPIPGHGELPSLVITEVMYNPRSQLPGNVETGFEWIEIYNLTGEPIDFGLTPYVFDDFAGSPRTAPNITAGVVPHGALAVLFSDELLTVAEMQQAWEGKVGTTINFIPVANWPGLNNNDTGGMNPAPAETIGLWDDLEDYAADFAAGRTNWTRTKAQVTYSDSSANGWPSDDGNASIYLNNLLADSAAGSSWTLSGGPQDSNGAYNPDPIIRTLIDHPGGDVGSPGIVPGMAALLGDYNQDGVVDAADYTVWRKNLGLVLTLPNEGASSGIVDQADYEVWKTGFGGVASGNALVVVARVPEPASAALLLLAAAGMPRRRVGGRFIRARRRPTLR